MNGPSPDAPLRPATGGKLPLIVPILLALGRALAEHERHAEASDALRRALAEPEDKPIGEVLVALVDALLAAGDRKEALRAVLEQGRTAPGEVLPALPRLTGLLSRATLRPVADLVTAEHWAAVVGEPGTPSPTRRRLLAFLVRARLALPDPAGAAALLDSAADIVDSDQELLVLRSDCQVRVRDLDAAVRSLVRAEALPGDRTAEIQLRLAGVYEQLARPQDALRHLDAAQHAGDDSEAPHALRALVLLQLHDADGAREAFLEAQRRAPESVATTRAGACVYLAAHDYERATETADAGLTHHPDHSGLSFLRFQVIVETGEDAADIERRLSRFLRRMPTPELEEWVERCVRIRPADDPAVHYFAGVLNQALQRPAEALRSADTALALLAAGPAPVEPVPLELPARRLRAVLLEPLLPEEAGAEYERAGQLASDRGELELAAQLLSTAEGLGELTQLSRWILADSLQWNCFAAAEPMKVDREQLQRALDVWEGAMRRALPEAGTAWPYITRARISLHYARIEPDPLPRVAEAAVWTQCFDALSESTEASIYTINAVSALIGLYGVRNELTWAAARSATTSGQYAPSGDLLATAAANAGDLDLMAAAVQQIEHEGDLNLWHDTQARLEVLRGNGAAALAALDEVPEQERNRGYHLWWRAIASWLTADWDELARTLAAAPAAASWEGISVWMHLLGGDPQRALQILAGLGDEESWSTDVAFEAALCRLAEGSGDRAADEALALRRAQQCRSFEDSTHLPMLAGILARCYPAAAAVFDRIAATAAARLPHGPWPLDAEADLAHLDGLARSGRDEGWATVAGLALRARVAVSRRSWSDAIAGYRSLIAHLDRFPEVEAGLAWILAELRTEADPVAALDEVEAAVAELRGHVSRRAGDFLPELTIGDMHLAAGRLDRAAALYQLVSDQPCTQWQHGLTHTRLHLVAVELARPGADGLLDRALQDFRADGESPWLSVASTLNGLVTSVESWRRLLDAWAPGDGETGGERYLLHLAGRFYLAAQLALQGRSAEAEQEYRAVLDEERRVYGEDSINTLITWQSLVEVVAAQGRWSEAEAMGRELVAVRTRALGADDPATLTSRQEVAWTLYNQGDLAGAEAEYREVLAARRRTLGADDPATLETWHNVAGVLTNQGRWAEAETEYSGVVQARSRTLGDYHRDTARSRSELAWTMTCLGRHREAEAEYRAIIAQHVAVLGEDDPETLTTRHRLAGALRESGDLAQAEAEFRAVRDARRRVLGDDHPDTVAAWYELAAVRRQLGDPAGAEAEYREVLDRERRIYGPEHPDTLITWHNVAATLADQGQWAEAEAEYREVLARKRYAVGVEHPDTLITWHNLAVTIADQGRAAEAESEYRQVLAARRRALGADAPATLETWWRLGQLLLTPGRWDDADAELTGLVAACRPVLGDEHVDTLAARFDLAWVWFKQGRLAEAEAEYRAVAEGRGRTLGPDDPATLAARSERCLVLSALDREDEAIAELREVTELRVRVLGADHEQTIATRYQLAEVLSAAGELAGAEEQARAVHDVRRHTLGDEHQFTVIAAYRLATALHREGELAEAEALYREVLAQEIRLYGPEAADTLITRHNLASLLNDDGRWGEAEVEYREVLAVRDRVLGADDPNTLEARFDLAWVLFKQGRPAEAEEQYRAVAEGRGRTFGPDDPATLAARSERCLALAELGRADEAIAEIGDLIEVRTRLLGEDHPDVRNTREWRAELLYGAGDHDGALAELSAVVASLTRVSGEDDEQTLIARYRLASVLQDAGRPAEAEAEYRAVLQRERRTLGDDDPSTYMTWFRLAEVLAGQGRREEAEAAYRTVLTARIRLLGDDDPATAEAREALDRLTAR